MNSVELDRAIELMNRTYDIPCLDAPDVGDELDGLTSRLKDFKVILRHEVDELDEIIWADDGTGLHRLVDLSDLLGDIIVYCLSEAKRHGIPIWEVLGIIMESNMTKLGADGKPIKDTRGKFLKGPGFQPPEPKITKLLRSKIG